MDKPSFRIKLSTKMARYKPTTQRGKRLAASAGVIAVAALVSASIFATGPSADPEPPAEKAWPVSVVTIEPTLVAPTFRSFGKVEAANIARLGVDLSATVKAVHVKEGEYVEAGTLLVSLDEREMKFSLTEQDAALEEHKADLRSIEMEFEIQKQAADHHASMHRVAQAKLERHEVLMQDRLISQSLLDEVVRQADEVHIAYQAHQQRLADYPNRIGAAKSRIRRAGALRSRAELDVSKTRITAPFAGPILKVTASPGDRTQFGVHLVEMADAQSFEVRASIPDAYAPHFHRSLDNLEGGITARTDSNVDLPLLRLSGHVRSGQSGIDAFFHWEPNQSIPVLGRVLDMRIVLPEEPNAVMLPAQAIYENNRIYAVRNERLHALTIERIGEARNAAGEYRVLVRSPNLNVGEHIVTTQLPKAITGLLVETRVSVGADA